MASASYCWFLTGSQALYGPETLKQVERQSQEIVDQLNGWGELPLHVQWQPVLTDPDEIHRVMLAANADLATALATGLSVPYAAHLCLAGSRPLVSYDARLGHLAPAVAGSGPS